MGILDSIKDIFSYAEKPEVKEVLPEPTKTTSVATKNKIIRNNGNISMQRRRKRS